MQALDYPSCSLILAADMDKARKRQRGWKSRKALLQGQHAKRESSILQEHRQELAANRLLRLAGEDRQAWYNGKNKKAMEHRETSETDIKTVAGHL